MTSPVFLFFLKIESWGGYFLSLRPEVLALGFGGTYVLRKTVLFRLILVGVLSFVVVPIALHKLEVTKRWEVGMAQEIKIVTIKDVSAKKIRRRKKTNRLSLLLYSGAKSIITSPPVVFLLKWIVLPYLIWVFWDLYYRYTLSGKGGKGGHLRFASQNADNLASQNPVEEKQEIISSGGSPEQGQNEPPIEGFPVPKVASIENPPAHISPAHILWLYAASVWDMPKENIPRFCVATQWLEQEVHAGRMPQNAITIFWEGKGNFLLPCESPVAGLGAEDGLVRHMRALDRQGRIRERQQRAMKDRRKQNEVQS